MNDRLTRAKVKLLLDHPFFGTLVLYPDWIEDNKISTFGTDGQAIYYNKDFTATLDDDELIGIIIHEVLHCALEHFARQGTREKDRWNLATDYATNDIIIQSGLVLPKNCYYNEDYTNKTAEEIYELLEKKAQYLPFDVHLEGKEGAPKGHKIEKKDWRVIVAQAYAVCKSRGDLPAGLVRAIDELFEPSMDWATLLRIYVTSALKSEYAWYPPNKRHIHNGVYLPSVTGSSIGTVVAGIDTSGSISQKDLTQFLSELVGICETFEDYEIYVLLCDAEVQDETILTPYDKDYRKIKMRGGGGTDFRPVFDRVYEKSINPSILIYFTDLDGMFPNTAPPYDVIWVTKGDSKAPFGITIKFKEVEK